MPSRSRSRSRDRHRRRNRSSSTEYIKRTSRWSSRDDDRRQNYNSSSTYNQKSSSSINKNVSTDDKMAEINIEDTARRLLVAELNIEKHEREKEKVKRYAKISKVCFEFLQGRCKYGDECKLEHDNSVAKITAAPCKSYALGKCSRGSSCTYIHGGGDTGLPEVPQIFSNDRDRGDHASYYGGSSSSRSFSKKRPCFSFEKGACNLGEKCEYSHDPDVIAQYRESKGTGNGGDRSVGICFNDQKGKCDRGESCRYTHEDGGRKTNGHDNTDNMNAVTAASGGRPRNSNKKARDFSQLMAGDRDDNDIDESKIIWGKEGEGVGGEGEDEKKPVAPRSKELSGMLAQDKNTGNMYKGIRLKWTEPPEARMPPPGWRLYVFKGVEQVETLHLHRQSAYLFGREDIIADIHLLHGSISKQHAVIQFRMKVIPSKTAGPAMSIVVPYILDLESTNKTKLNGEAVEAARYVELKNKDMLQFGFSSRQYVLIQS